ncbi:MAG: hypothetical protein AB7F98_05125 [Novosphingobium sp.]
MKRFLFALPMLLAAAAPAYATGGFSCETRGAKKIEVNIVFTHTTGGGLVGATLIDNDKEIPTEKAQWWLDGTELRLLLTDPDLEREEVEIRVRGSGEVMVGTLKRGGRTYRVRCEESG